MGKQQDNFIAERSVMETPIHNWRK